MIKKNKRRKVSISLKIIEDIFLTGIDTYKKEAVAIVSGIIKHNIYYIQKISPLQIAKRKLTEVDYTDKREKNLIKTLENLGYEILGDLHSHSDYFNWNWYKTPSKEDKEDMINNPNKIYFILFLDKIYKLSAWRLKNKELIVSIETKDRKLKGLLKCYYYDKEKKRYLKADIKPAKDLEEMLR